MTNALMKRLALIVLCLALFIAPSLSGKAERALHIVSIRGEAEPFAQDAQTLDLYVVPLLGADCIVLRCGEKWMLVDMGKAGNFEQIKAVLSDLGVERIDLAFNTHPHSDHIGGMSLLFDVVSVDRFVTTFPLDYTGPNARQRSTIQALNEAGIPVEEMGDGSRFSLGGVAFQVMKTDLDSTNAASAMLHLSFGNTTLLLAADIDRPAQYVLSQRYDIKADILKYPHHGLEQLDKQFMKEVDPVFAFFTHGSSNTKEAQELLDRYDVPYMFATWGVIHLQSNGERWILDQDITEEAQYYRAYKERK